MKSIVLTALLIIQFGLFNLKAQTVSPELKAYKVEFAKYVDLMDMREMFKVMIPNVLSNFKEGMGEKVPATYWVQLEKEMMGGELDTLLSQLMPIYMKYLSIADLKELNKFLASPSGKSFVKSQLAVQPESMDVAENWGRSLAQKIITKLEKDGYSPR